LKMEKEREKGTENGVKREPGRAIIRYPQPHREGEELSTTTKGRGGRRNIDTSKKKELGGTIGSR